MWYVRGELLFAASKNLRAGNTLQTFAQIEKLVGSLFIYLSLEHEYITGRYKATRGVPYESKSRSVPGKRLVPQILPTIPSANSEYLEASTFPRRTI